MYQNSDIRAKYIFYSSFAHTFRKILLFYGISCLKESKSWKILRNGKKREFFGQTTQVCPPGVATNIVEGGCKVVHFICNAFNFIPNGVFFGV